MAIFATMRHVSSRTYDPTTIATTSITVLFRFLVDLSIVLRNDGVFEDVRAIT